MSLEIDDQTLLVEEPGDAAGFAHVAVALGEDAPHVGDGPVAVVGHDLYQHGDAAGTVALVGGLLVVDPLQPAGTLS